MDCALTQTQEQHLSSQLLPGPASRQEGVAQLLSLINSTDTHDLEKPEIKIGRHPTSDLVIGDPRVSATHLRIYRDASFRYFIQELGSNGCFVNDLALKKGDTRALQHGDEISICVPGPSQVKDVANSTDEMRPFAAFLFRLPEKVVGKQLPAQSSRTPGGQEHVTDEWVLAKWDIRVTLGHGNFSTVKLGVRVGTGEKHAMKVIDKHKFLAFQAKRESELQLESEAKVLMTLNHPGIVRCFEWFQTELLLYLVMEVVEGGDLLQCILQDGCFTEGQAVRLFRSLCIAVKYLHGRSIVHRDIKPENVLLTSKDRDRMLPKLGDFGLAKINMKSQDCRTFCGTPHYFAPEVINSFYARQEQTTGKRGYGTQADMWSLGVVLYILLSGNPPFEEEGLYEQILAGKYEFDVDEWTIVSPEAKELVQRLMMVDPKGRLSIDQAIAHPWLSRPPDSVEEAGLEAVAASAASIDMDMPGSKRRRCNDGVVEGKLTTAPTEPTELSLFGQKGC